MKLPVAVSEQQLFICSNSVKKHCLVCVKCYTLHMNGSPYGATSMEPFAHVHQISTYWDEGIMEPELFHLRYLNKM